MCVCVCVCVWEGDIHGEVEEACSNGGTHALRECVAHMSQHKTCLAYTYTTIETVLTECVSYLARSVHDSP